MVEQLTLNQLVPGSSPGGRTSFRKSFADLQSCYFDPQKTSCDKLVSINNRQPFVFSMS